MSKSATPPKPTLRSELWRLTNLSHQTLHGTKPPYPPINTTSPSGPEFKKTNTELRRLIMDEEMKIAKLQSQVSNLPSDPQRRLRAEIAANRESFNTPAYYPNFASPLNIFIAFRYVQVAADSYATLIPQTRREVEEVSKALAEAKAALKEQESLKAALETRLKELEDPNTVVKGEESVVEMKNRTKQVKKQTKRTLMALRKFFEGYLVTALEMEELGGPAVGLGREEVDGKRLLRKAKGQMTIEDAFKAGRKREREREKRGRRAREDEEEEEEEDEDEGVVGDLEALLEELMTSSLKPDPYVTIKRESAVTRFLVRAKVAEFHPRDSTRLKLLNFAGTFED